jgi:hypothetical protein
MSAYWRKFSVPVTVNDPTGCVMPSDSTATLYGPEDIDIMNSGHGSVDLQLGPKLPGTTNVNVLPSGEERLLIDGAIMPSNVTVLPVGAKPLP